MIAHLKACLFPIWHSTNTNDFLHCNFESWSFVFILLPSVLLKKEVTYALICEICDNLFQLYLSVSVSFDRSIFNVAFASLNLVIGKCCKPYLMRGIQSIVNGNSPKLLNNISRGLTDNSWNSFILLIKVLFII